MLRRVGPGMLSALVACVLVHPLPAQDRGVAYEAQYTLVGFLLRATNVCGGSKEQVEATFSLLDAAELKAFSRSFPRQTEQWMKKGAELFNTGVLKDGIPSACQYALETLRKASARGGDGASSTGSASDSSYLGKWYLQDVNECKRRPGESSEMISYAMDRMIGPELNCKIVRIMPREGATEIDLLCDGEGSRAVRMRETLRVTNNRLQVSYVANKRKMTDNYLRCPSD